MLGSVWKSSLIGFAYVVVLSLNPFLSFFCRKNHFAPAWGDDLFMLFNGFQCTARPVVCGEDTTMIDAPIRRNRNKKICSIRNLTQKKCADWRFRCSCISLNAMIEIWYTTCLSCFYGFKTRLEGEITTRWSLPRSGRMREEKEVHLSLPCDIYRAAQDPPLRLREISQLQRLIANPRTSWRRPSNIRLSPRRQRRESSKSNLSNDGWYEREPFFCICRKYGWAGVLKRTM